MSQHCVVVHPPLSAQTIVCLWNNVMKLLRKFKSCSRNSGLWHLNVLPTSICWKRGLETINWIRLFWGWIFLRFGRGFPWFFEETVVLRWKFCSILWSPLDQYEPTFWYDTSSHQMSKEKRAPQLVEIYWGWCPTQLYGDIINHYKATRIPIKQPVFHWKHQVGVGVLEVNYDQSRVTSLLLLDSSLSELWFRSLMLELGGAHSREDENSSEHIQHLRCSIMDLYPNGSLPSLDSRRWSPVLRWFEYWSCCWKSLPAIRARAWCGWIWSRRAWTWWQWRREPSSTILTGIFAWKIPLLDLLELPDSMVLLSWPVASQLGLLSIKPEKIVLQRFLFV